MIEVEKLESGLTIVKNKHVNPHMTGIAVYVKTGSSHEKEKEEGISHFLEHMHFKGTGNFNQRELSFIIDSLGGHVNAFTSKEVTCYHANILDENAKKAANFFLDILNDSTFETEEIEKEKGVVIQEMHMTQDSPDDFLFDAIDDYVFKGGSYESRILGTEETVSSLTREALFEYKKEHYVKDNVVIVICGQDDQGLPEIFDEGFKNLKQTGEKIPFVYGDYKPKYFNEVKNVEQVHLILAKPREFTNYDNYISRKLATMILGGGMSSRLFQTVREDKGLAYSVFAADTLMGKAGLTYISAGLAANKLEDAIKSIKAELENLNTKGITSKELELAKEKMKTSIAFAHESTERVLGITGSNYMLWNEVKDMDYIFDKINHMIIDDVNEEVSKITNTNEYTVGVVSGTEVDVERIYNN